MFGLTWESSVRWGKRKTLRNKWKRRGVTGCTGCLTARLQLHKIWPSTGGKEKQIFMGGFTVSKILGVDKVPCGWEKSRREKSLGFIWGLVSLSTSWESLKGPSRWVEENSDGGQPDIHHLCCFRARQYTLQRKPLKESCVCWCARAKRLQLCTILSMSQRLRSLKITRRDRCGLRLIFFFFTPLFLWLGVSRISLVYRRWLSCLGFLMVPWPIEPPIQTPCKAAAKESTQCLFVVCSHKHGSIFIWAQCHSLGKASFWFSIHELKWKLNKSKRYFSHMSRGRENLSLNIGEIIDKKKNDNITISLCAQDPLSENISAYFGVRNAAE